jgi:hypothetical protein
MAGATRGSNARATRTDQIVERKMKRVIGEFERGELRSGSSGTRVRSRRQAVAIGLSEARRAGARIPKRPRPS